MKNRIIVTSRMDLSAAQRKWLELCGEVTYHGAEVKSADEWIDLCRGYQFVCSGKPGMTAPIGNPTEKDFGIYHLDRETFVSHPFVSVAILSKERLQRAGVQLGYAPGCNRFAVAEWVFAMLLDLFRDFSRAVNLQDDQIRLFRTMSLRDKKIAILGSGAVGTEVCKLAQAFGMRVSVFHRDGDLHGAIAGSHVVVNCLSNLPENEGLLGETFFAAMDEGSFFVTMTSPSIWSADALLDALDSQHLAGAAIDVGAGFAGDISAPVYQQVVGRKVVLATPQIAHFSDISAKTSYDMMIENIEAAVEKRKIPYLWA